MMLDYVHIPPFLIFGNVFSGALFAIFRKKVKLVKSAFLAVALVSLCLTIVNAYRVIWFGSVVYNLGNWDNSVGIAFKINVHSSLMLIILTLGFAISAFGIYKNECLPVSTTVYACLLFAGLCGACITADLFNTYVFVELSSIATYVLITANTSGNRASYKVSFDYLTIASFAGILILIGILLIYAATGSLSMIVINHFLENSINIPIKNVRLLQYGYVFMTVGMLIKTGFYPMYTWLIKTYITSSSSISALLASTVTKVFIFTIYKNNMLFGSSMLMESMLDNIGNFLSFFAIIGMIIMGLSNIGERSLKKEISVSSMIQVCYFVMSLYIFNDHVMIGLMMQMLVHSISISTLFLILDESFYKIDKSYSPETTREIPKYLLTRGKITKFAFVLLILNIAGYPLTSGFVGKWMLFRGFVEKGELFKFAALVISTGIGLVYTWRIIERIVFFEHHHPNVANTKTSQHWIIKIVALCAVLLSFSCGVFVLKKPFDQARSEYGNYF